MAKPMRSASVMVRSDNGDATTDVYFDRYTCRRNADADIFKITASRP